MLTSIIHSDIELLQETFSKLEEKQMNNTFHDRYFIIDDNKLYHCGTSINKIGYKNFSITLVNDDFIIKLLLDKVNRLDRGE